MARVVLRNSEEQDNLSSHNTWWCTSLLTMFIIACYFTLSICLTFYMKVFSNEYKYPLSIVLVHLVFKFIVALVCRKVFELATNQKRVLLCWHNHLHKIAPTGIASGLDIGFSQWGLQLIAVSLYTMTKSTSVIFILIFSLVFQLEKKSWFVFLVVLMISGGLVMFTYKTTAFDYLGFGLVLLASFSSGLRWTLAQFVMQRSDLHMNNPIDMVYHVQPWMIMSILPLASIFEGRRVVTDYVESKHISHEFIQGLLVSGVLACAMEFAEFMVVSKTSSLTLSIVGMVKEIVTVLLAVETENRPMVPVNVLGLVICLTGVTLHVMHKSYRQYRTTARTGSGADQAKPLLLEETSARFLLTTSDENDSEDETEVLFNVLNSRDR
uniref:Solute carrier family 35 member C2 n=1 Tax=Cacopsylla melanoneura TaxID=428564 RepID=A0A8D8QGP6_9HEMI